MCKYFDILMNMCTILDIKPYEILQNIQGKYLYFLT